MIRLQPTWWLILIVLSSLNSDGLRAMARFKAAAAAAAAADEQPAAALDGGGILCYFGNTLPPQAGPVSESSLCLASQDGLSGDRAEKLILKCGQTEKAPARRRRRRRDQPSRPDRRPALSAPAGEHQLCRNALAGTRMVCKFLLQFERQPFFEAHLPTTFSGCDGQNIQYFLFITGEKFKFNDQNFLYGFDAPDTNAELAETIINGTKLSGLEIGRMLEIVSSSSRLITLENNEGLTKLEKDLIKWDQFKQLKAIDIKRCPIKEIRSESFILGPSVERLFLHELDLSQAKIQPKAIAISNPRCRQSSLTVTLKGCNLGGALVEPLIQFEMGADNKQCANASQASASIYVDLFDNKFDGSFPEQVFAELLKQGSKLAEDSNKQFWLTIDPIDCCSAKNSWLFEAANEKYRKSINTTCQQSQIDFQQIQAESIMSKACSIGATTKNPLEGSGSGAEATLPQWAMYALIAGTILLVSFIAILVFCWLPSAKQAAAAKTGSSARRKALSPLNPSNQQSKSSDVTVRSSSHDLPAPANKSRSASARNNNSRSPKARQTSQLRAKSKPDSPLPESEVAFLQPKASEALSRLPSSGRRSTKSPNSTRNVRLVSPGSR